MITQLTTETQFKSNVNPIKQKTKSKVKHVEVEENRDNPYLNQNSMTSTFRMIDSVVRVKSSFSITYTNVLMILAVWSYYMERGYGLSCSEISRVMGYVGGMIDNLRKRLERYVKDGLLCVVGTGMHSCKLYAPTDYCDSVIRECLGL